MQVVYRGTQARTQSKSKFQREEEHALLQNVHRQLETFTMEMRMSHHMLQFVIKCPHAKARASFICLMK
jgi:hypothetical protein